MENPEIKTKIIQICLIGTGLIGGWYLTEITSINLLFLGALSWILGVTLKLFIYKISDLAWKKKRIITSSIASGTISAASELLMLIIVWNLLINENFVLKTSLAYASGAALFELFFVLAICTFIKFSAEDHKKWITHCKQSLIVQYFLLFERLIATSGHILSRTIFLYAWLYKKPLIIIIGILCFAFTDGIADFFDQKTKKQEWFNHKKSLNFLCLITIPLSIELILFLYLFL